MLEKAKEYHEYARECVRMAEQADSEETRGKLLELAQGVDERSPLRGGGCDQD